jgi:multidrug efflux pump subunit AcrB
MNDAPEEQSGKSPLSKARTQISRTFEITTRRPVAIFMVVLAVAVFGYISYQQLPLTLMPDISYPTLTIRTDYPDTAPQEVENLISRQIEQRLGVVNNLVSIVSVSRAGLSDVILEFGWDTNMNDAVQTVRENLDRLNLPRGVSKPLILRYDPTQDPIMRIGLYGKVDLYTLRLIAEDEIKQELEALKGVAAARVQGGLEEEIRVSISERQLSQMGLGIAQVNRRLEEENVNLAGGSLLDGQTQYLVRTLNEFQSIEEIRNLVIGERGGVEIRLKDIGSVDRSHKEREIITRVNGIESVEIEIYKEADANIVSTAKRVMDRLFGTPEQLAYAEKLRAGTLEKAKSSNRRDQVRQFIQLKEMTSFIAFSLPEGLEMEMLSDQSKFIERSVDEVKSTAVIGGILAILILYIFLRNPTNTAIVGLAIPISIVATFAPMQIFGVSLNIMSLGGLALGIGMLVDNSIVVLESIFRCREEGDDLVPAAIRGTGEVGGAVFASTLTTVAVFFPIVFVEGVAGQVFGDMSLTVVFSLLASLGVALFFIPMLASRRVSLGAAPDGDGSEDASTIARAFSSELLQFRSVESLKRLADQSEEVGTLHLLGRGFLGFFWLFGEFLLRLLWVMASLVLMILKAVTVILGPPLYFPIAALIQKLRKKTKAGQVWNSMCSWFESELVFGSPLIHRIWHDLLVFKSARILGAAIPAGFGWTWRAVNNSVRWAFSGSLLKKILKAVPGLIRLILTFLLFPLAPIYFVLRFLIFHIFILSGKIIVQAMMLLFLIGQTLLFLSAVVLVPVLKPLLFLFEKGFGSLSRLYPEILGWALQNRTAVIAMAIIPFAICWFVLLPRVGQELIPQVHQGEFNLEMALPVGTPLEFNNNTIRQVEARILSDSDAARIASVIGVDKTSISSSDQGEHTSRITIVLKETDEDSEEMGSMTRFAHNIARLPVRIWGGITGHNLLAMRETELMEDIRGLLVEFPQLRIDFSRPALFSFKTPIELEIRGYDLGDLARLGRDVERALSDVPGLYDVKSSLQRGSPEVQIIYRRDLLASYDLNLRAVATLVRQKVQGNVVTRFREADRRIDVLVRVDEADRAGVADLRRLVVNPNGSVPIRLSAVADIQVKEGPSEIRRIDQQRAVLISANVSGVDLGTVTGMIQKALDDVEVPPDVTFAIGGQNKEMQTSMQSLLFALALAIFLVYIVMASQFESFIHPFVIIFTIPLALIGVTFVLFVTRISLSIVVFLGLIMLAGIVVNNAIVLVDYINHLRATGMEKVDAIIQAGSVRLRPILMTTATTVLGLLPMALGLGEGAEIRTPMAITVVAGLISATLLTLIIIPTVYSILDRKQ